METIKYSKVDYIQFAVFHKYLLKWKGHSLGHLEQHL